MSGIPSTSSEETTTEDGSLSTQASIIRSSRQRKEAFDKEIDEEEKKALEDFKRQLREAVLQT